MKFAGALLRCLCRCQAHVPTAEDDVRILVPGATGCTIHCPRWKESRHPRGMIWRLVLAAGHPSPRGQKVLSANGPEDGHILEADATSLPQRRRRGAGFACRRLARRHYHRLWLSFSANDVDRSAEDSEWQGQERSRDGKLSVEFAMASCLWHTWRDGRAPPRRPTADDGPSPVLNS